MTPKNITELAELIESLAKFEHDGGAGGYEASADAMWKAAAATFHYVAREVGATGYQASWAALKFHAEVMHIDGPFMIMRAEDALFPQYDLPGRVDKFLAENQRWLAEQAKEKLEKWQASPTTDWTDEDGIEHSTPSAAPAVVEHWRRLVKS